MSAAFSSGAFSVSAFSVDAFAFDTVAPPVESSGGGWVGPHFRYRAKDEDETLLLLGII